MILDDILKIASAIQENEVIPKENLKIIYYITEEAHRALDLEIYNKRFGDLYQYKPTDVIEINAGPILFSIEKLKQTKESKAKKKWF